MQTFYCYLLLVDLYIPLSDNIEMCETDNFRFQRHSKLELL